MSTLERAIQIAVQAHAGQFDKAGQPYVLHPLRCMMQMRTEEQQIIAVLHDVVEDSAWTLDGLRAEGFSERIVAAIDSLSRREGESYEDFIRRAGQNPVAVPIKLADLHDNLDASRMRELTDKDVERLRRYLRALAILEAE